MSNSLHNVIAQAEQVILGKPHQIRLALACLLARGHLLIEDLPGVGKTTLARSLGLQPCMVGTKTCPPFTCVKNCFTVLPHD